MYITDVTPKQGSGIPVTGTYGAVLAARITGNGTRLYKEDCDSYNLFYQGYETAPSEDTLREWPDGKIPLLQ